MMNSNHRIAGDGRGLQSGFAAIDITPPPGTPKIGWMEDLCGDVVLDPLFARAAVFDNGSERIGFIQLDLLSIRWTQVHRIRAAIEKAFHFPGDHIMVSATHNHAGPAVAGVAPVPRDEAYLRILEARCVACFGQALASAEPSELGFDSRFNAVVAHNRRCRMRDGTVRSQTFATKNPLFLCLEGPRDTELTVLAARSRSGRITGCLVNYACHPTHHGGTHEISAGFPGVLADRLRAAGCPVTLYLNGAYGNVITTDYERGISLSKEEAGESLAGDVRQAIESMAFTKNWPLHVRRETLQLDYRKITDEEFRGTVFGAQRFRSDALYEDAIRRWRRRIEERGTQPAELQMLGLGDVRWVGVPAEYFVEYQLDIKQAVHPLRAHIVGGANGMIGYVPTRAAFQRGGYETTLGPPSRMAPDTGDRIASAAIRILRRTICVPSV